MAEDDVRAAVVAERTELARMLAGLTPQQWGAPTLCAGWAVRDVVAHLTMAFRIKPAKFVLEMVRDRGNFGVMADRTARRDAAALGDAGLLAALRDNVGHPWRPPGGGDAGALSHDVIHGLDITVGAGLDRRPPVGRVALVLRGLAGKNLRYFGTDLSGVRLEATDLDWAYGEGEPLLGTAADLLLVICGRKIPQSRLTGTAAGRFAA